MKKTKSKNLSKAQLKKLKGGLINCDETKCVGNTCGIVASAQNCSGQNANSGNTVSIVDGTGNSSPKLRK